MRNFQISLLSITIVVFFNACNKKNQSKSSDSKIIEVSYFGQKPPGTTAEIFAPEIVSVNGRYEYAVSFSPDMNEMYFSGNKEEKPQVVYFSRLKDEKWSTPKIANFTKGKKKNELEGFVSLNGEKIFFTAYDSIFSDENIWYVNRLENSWSEAIKLDSPINDDIVFYSNTSENGDLFYTSISQWKMYYAPNKNGEFPEVHEVGIEYGGHGFISPSQDFILVDAQKENEETKDRDIHVCFKDKDGTWSKPINLGDAVNSKFAETCPSLTPDGKYLFFSRYDEEGGLSNIYWISAEVINKVKSVEFDRH
ncbi:PD40 domain-containing protein [Winogradskyella sp. PC-19]|uniref:PD40 domain-containing protein n=1 Tax=Winogradskyella sp. PC-19 TaxID=754417 RepID=UPI000B3CD703|nr:PD40 domain-containing protein [Winogradskyella sp. PC-19]